MICITVLFRICLLLLLLLQLYTAPYLRVCLILSVLSFCFFVTNWDVFCLFSDSPLPDLDSYLDFFENKYFTQHDMYLTDILRYSGKMWLKEPTLLSYVWNRYYFILDKQGKLSQLDEECAGQFVRLFVCPLVSLYVFVCLNVCALKKIKNN